jgi:thiol-disulfide isomerase/thioredoxin
MKKIIYFIAALAIISCKNEPKDYVTFSGTITDQNSDSVVVRSRTYSKTIQVQEDGTFSDTLNVAPGVYSLYDGGESTSIFLKNGYDIKMTLDTKMFDESAKYTGTGSENSNFLAEKSLLEEKLLDIENFTSLKENEIGTALDKVKSELNEFYVSNKAVDTSLTNGAIKTLEPMMKYYKSSVGDQVYLKTKLVKGTESPSFEEYENNDGSKTSLSDLKGKYVYVDVWATWCGPCKREIPSLKKVEKAYHGKNIEFVSISVDALKDHEAWKKMIIDKELGGIQLFADNDWKSDFVTDYKINGIPRFILIDPSGNIVSADAPRPSDSKLIELFNQENI